jgi:DNA-binding MarR family transcriptional regulator
MVQATTPDRLLAALIRLNRTLRHPLPGAEGSLDRTQAFLMALVRAQEGIRSSEIGRELGLDQSTVSRHCSELVQQGMLSRKEDPADGRAFRLFTTSAGQEYLTERASLQAAALGSVTAEWSEGDLTSLISLVERFADDLSAFKSRETSRA